MTTVFNLSTAFGWCLSDLNTEPSIAVTSPLECWNACVAEYDGVLAADFYPTPELCFCQDACECLVESDAAELVVSSNLTVPGACSSSNTDDDALDPSLALHVDVGWCFSELNQQTTNGVVDSAQSCWDACLEEFGSITAIDFYPESNVCVCQSSCDCIFEDEDVQLVLSTDLALPEFCEPDRPGPTDDVDDTGDDDLDTPDCDDDMLWHADNDTLKNCTWVAADVSRCSNEVSVDDVWAFRGCQSTCDACPRDCDGPYPDSTTWHRPAQPSKDCVWVGDYASARCRLVGADGTPAWESCPFACYVCEYANSTCVDDALWRAIGDSSDDVRDCSWVAEAKSNRCKLAGAEGHGRAFEACRRSCHSCKQLLTGACQDSTTFAKKGEPQKNCEDWVGEFPDRAGLISNRCAVKSDTNGWAYDECPATCKTC